MGEVTPIINIQNLKPLCGKHKIVRIIDMANLHSIPICEQEKRQVSQQNQLLKTMNATIVTGEYTDRNTGQTKKSYLTIGKLFVYNDGGMSLKLDALPMNGQNISFYPPKPKPNNNHGGNGQQQQPQGQNQNRYN